MQLATPVVEPLPDDDSALQDAICAGGATPATPMPLLVVAAIVPDTWVPCWLSSLHLLATIVGSPPNRPRNPKLLTPAHATVLPARSGWFCWMPVSTTPTRTPLAGKTPAPKAMSQPSGAFRSAP